VEHKFFFWLVMQDRCWTNDRRHRHGISDDATCTLYLQQDESIDHLTIACVFSREVWLLMLQKCGWQDLAPDDGDTLVNWWLRSRDLVPLPRRAAFDSLVILVARQLWLECNDRIFHATACLPAQLIAKLTRTVDDWSNAGLLARSMLYRE
jgi:hypothetical protein